MSTQQDWGVEDRVPWGAWPAWAGGGCVTGRGGGTAVADLPAHRKLAAELHDGVVQELFAARLDVDELLSLPGLDGAARQLLRRIAARLDDGSNQVRSLLVDLFEGGTEDADTTVFDRIRSAIADFRRRADITIDLRIGGSGAEPRAGARTLLLRTVREGLANVIKHSQASQAVLRVRRGAAWWTAEVDDDGVGDPAQLRLNFTRVSASSFGLASLAEDTRQVGGRMWIRRSECLGGVSLGVAVPTANEG